MIVVTTASPDWTASTVCMLNCLVERLVGTFDVLINAGLPRHDTFVHIKCMGSTCVCNQGWSSSFRGTCMLLLQHSGCLPQKSGVRATLKRACNCIQVLDHSKLHGEPSVSKCVATLVAWLGSNKKGDVWSSCAGMCRPWRSIQAYGIKPG